MNRMVPTDNRASAEQGRRDKRIQQKLNRILKALNGRKQRATYGAVAGVLGEPGLYAWNLGNHLGARCPWASWVVRAKGGKDGKQGQPSKYEDWQKHPDLTRHVKVLNSPDELRGFLSEAAADKRDFLTLLDCSPEELQTLVKRAGELKRKLQRGKPHRPLAGRTAALILQLASTRTRVAFEAGLHQLGGHAIFLGASDTQLGRGEPIADTARVLSAMTDALIIRMLDHEQLNLCAAAATVPVINAMTGRYHPCQLLADIQAFEELRGAIKGRKAAFVGDGHNMCRSYANAARQWGFGLKIACPEGYGPELDIPPGAGPSDPVQLAASPREAVAGADLVVTDVWSSMGHEVERDKRRQAFLAYQVDEALLDCAGPEALFLHCLPAHRGEEVDHRVLDDRRSGVWVAAGNRLHSQKALLEFLLA